MAVEAESRLERVEKAAREQRKREAIMLGLVAVSAHGRAECAAVNDWINAGAALDDALEATD